MPYFPARGIKITSLTASKVLALPRGPIFSNGSADRMESLFAKLHELALAYDTVQLEWNTPWGVSYDAAYLLAELQVQVEYYGSFEEKLVLLGYQIQFWGMSSTFVSQSGI
jgi:hypothetical protein